MSDDALPDAGEIASRPDLSQPTRAPRRRSLLEWFRTPIDGALWAWKRRPIFLRSFDDARRYGVNVLVLGVLVLLVIVTWRATFESLIVVEPIAIPKAIEERGYTAAIVSQRLIDEVHKINDQASSKRGRTSIANESRFASLSSIQLPAAGFSLRSLISTLRDLLGVEDRKLGGEILVKASADGKAPTSYMLLLRVEEREGRKVREVEAADVDELIRKAARPAVELLDPYILASFYFVNYEWENADNLAEVISLTKKKDVAKWALLLRGIISQIRYNNDAATDYFRQALELDPLFVMGHINLAFALAESNKYYDAITELETALTIDPNSAAVYASWGEILRIAGRAEEALEKFELALQKDRHEESAILGLASVFVTLDRHADARKQCRVATIIRPNAELLYHCGITMERMDDLDAAMEAYRKSLLLQPRSHPAHRAIGDVLARRNDLSGALSKYTEAFALNPTDMGTLLSFGNLYVRLGYYNEAIEKFEAAGRVDPRFVASEIVKTLAMYRDRGAVP